MVHGMRRCGVAAGLVAAWIGGRAAPRTVTALCLVLVALCANASAEWLYRPLGADGASDLSAPGLDDSGWEAVTLPHRTWDDTQPQNYVYGWYRCHFTPDPAFAGRDVVLKLGIVDDADATYCNGTLVGSTGAFPPRAASAYNQDREYVIPAGLLRFGADNVLAVKVYDTIGTGGVLGDGRLRHRLRSLPGQVVRTRPAAGVAGGHRG